MSCHAAKTVLSCSVAATAEGAEIELCSACPASTKQSQQKHNNLCGASSMVWTQRLLHTVNLTCCIWLQMLLRGVNAVGYTSYADNVVNAFVAEARTAGVDIFRVFDSLNYVDNLKFGIDSVHQGGGVAEGTLCYTGDVSDPSKKKVICHAVWCDCSSSLYARSLHLTRASTRYLCSPTNLVLCCLKLLLQR